jgi:transcriptional regulator GlxA family with amidase domain
MKLEIFHLEGSADDGSVAEPETLTAGSPGGWPRTSPRRSSGDPSPRTSETHNPGVAKAILMIRNEYSRPLTVGSLARECGMSVRTLHRLYRSATGTTISKDLATRRIRAAADMLTIDGLKLEPIAMETGLHSAKNLCRLFKEHFGITPGQWKESRRHQGALSL